MHLRAERLDWRQILSIFAVCLLGTLLVWGAVQMRNAHVPLEEVGPGAEYLVDRQGDMTLQDVLGLSSDAWQEETRSQLSFGMSEHPYWFRFTINPGQQPSTLLELDYGLLDIVDLWFISDGNIIANYREGDAFPFDERTIAHEKFLFDVPAGYETLTVVVRAVTAGTMRLPFRLWNKDTFVVFNGEHSLVMGLFFGFMAAMALSNLFFYVTTRSAMFMSYCGYVMFLALSLASLHGLTFKYFWPDNVWLQSRSVGIFATATILFALIFTAQLLEVKKHSPRLDRLLWVTAGIFLLATIASFIVPYSIYIQIFLLLMVAAVCVILPLSLYLMYRGVKLALFYAVAWGVLLFSGFVTSLDNWNLIHLDTPPHYILMFGATVETFLLALALAIGYNHQRQETFAKQTMALAQERHEREAKEEILRVQQAAQEELEYKVEERTLELEIALRELSETNRELEKKNTTDALTGIRNRAYFDKKYLAEVRRSRREQTELSVVMLDVDHFKQINDTYGHLAGDECIRFVAEHLKENLRRPSDDVCRYGGEEFAIIMPNTAQQGALNVIESVRQQLAAATISTPAGAVTLTVSAGICTAVVTGALDESEILKRADEALYQAKNLGRNRVEVSQLDYPTAANQDVSK